MAVGCMKRDEEAQDRETEAQRPSSELVWFMFLFRLYSLLMILWLYPVINLWLFFACISDTLENMGCLQLKIKGKGLITEGTRSKIEILGHSERYWEPKPWEWGPQKVPTAWEKVRKLMPDQKQNSLRWLPRKRWVMTLLYLPLLLSAVPQSPLGLSARS